MRNEIELLDPIKKLKIIKTLQKLPIFIGLHDEDYESLLSICNITTFRPDQCIFKEKDPSLNMCVLLSGAVEISTQKKGVIYTVKQGEVFGEIGLISQKARTATSKSKENTILLQIKRDDFNFLLGTKPRICAMMLRNITLSLSEHIVRMNNLATDETLQMKRIR